MDIEYLLILQDFRNGAGAFLNGFFNQLANIMVSHGYFAAIALVLWCIQKRQGQITLMSFSLGNIFYQSLKNIFCVYRPFTRDARLIPSKSASGYSFPSGHSMYGTSLFGSLGLWQWRQKRKWLGILFFLCVGIVCFSRNYLGVHTPQDVAVGSILTIGLIFLSEWIMRLVERKPNADWIITLCGLALCAIHLIYFSLKEYPVDLDADGNVIVTAAKAIGSCYTTAGYASGFFLGWLMERRWIHYTVDGSFLRKAIRWLVGGMGLWYLCGSFTQLCKANMGSNWGTFSANAIVSLFLVAIYPLICMLVRKIIPQAKK